MPCRTLAVFIFLALMFGSEIGLPVHALGDAPGVTVLSTDNYGLSIELSLPDFKIQKRPEFNDSSASQDARLPDKDSSCQQISLAGWAKSSRPGYPELPLTALLIQTPQSGEVRLEELESASESLADVNLCPVPRLSVSEDGQPISENARNTDAYSSWDFLPGALAEVSSSGFFRNTAVARIVIHPFQWNPMTKELRYIKKARLRVQFDNPMSLYSGPFQAMAASVSEDVFARLQQHSIVNYQGLGDISQQVTAPTPTTTPNRLSALTTSQLRIEIKKDGIYRLYYQDLINAGLNPQSIDPRTFRLFNRDTEVAIKVAAKFPYRFRAGDYLEFYAQGISTDFTDTNVYWLSWGDVKGKRAAQVSGRVGKGKKLSSFNEILRVEENHLMWDGMPEAPEKDYWFWEKITAPFTRSYTLTVPFPVAGQANAVVRVGYRGRSTSSPHPDHHTRLLLNGTQIGNAYWDSDAEYVQYAKIPSGLLKDGTNTLTLAAPGDTGAVVDIFYLNWVEVLYARYFTAVDDTLAFTVQGNGRYRAEVKGLSKPVIRIYEVTNPYGVQEVVSFSVKSDGASYKATFEDSIAGSKTYHVETTNAVKTPQKTTLRQPTDMNSTSNGADLIVITTDEFRSAVEPLCTFHQGEGLRVKSVSVEDIYNEFSHGIVDPTAIRDFLKAAYDRWQRPAPTYVLLVGDASVDYRGYLGAEKKSRVPTHLSFTESLGLTPEDNRFVCVSGDDSLPDMMIGRIPGNSPESVAQTVNKIIDYEQSSAYQPTKALFAADNNEIGFENLDEDLASYLPSSFAARKA